MNARFRRFLAAANNGDLAETILDRGRLLELRGTSFRTRHLERSGRRAAQAADLDPPDARTTGGRPRISGIPGPEFL